MNLIRICLHWNSWSYRKTSFLPKIIYHPKPLSRSQITPFWISQRRRVIFLYLFRASDEGIRLCKSRAGRVSRVPSDKTLFRRWSVRSPSRSAVANIRGERYDTILIKTLPLAFCHAIVSLIASLTDEKKRSANVWIIRLNLHRGMHLKDGSRTRFLLFIYYSVCR